MDGLQAVARERSTHAVEIPPAEFPQEPNAQERTGNQQQSRPEPSDEQGDQEKTGEFKRGKREQGQQNQFNQFHRSSSSMSSLVGAMVRIVYGWCNCRALAKPLEGCA